MERQLVGDEGDPLIFCTNHVCASNGGDNASAMHRFFNDAFKTAEKAKEMRDLSEALLADCLRELVALRKCAAQSPRPRSRR